MQQLMRYKGKKFMCNNAAKESLQSIKKSYALSYALTEHYWWNHGNSSSDVQSSITSRSEILQDSLCTILSQEKRRNQDREMHMDPSSETYNLDHDEMEG